MKSLLTLLLFGCCASAQILSYDPDRRTPWLDNPQFATDDFSWWANNTGEPSRLFLNDVYQSQEAGTNDINLPGAWSVQSKAQHVKVGVVDLGGAHGQRETNLVSQIAIDAEVILSSSVRLQASDVANGLNSFIGMGCRIVIITVGFGYDANLSNACLTALASNVLVFCAVPNSEVNIDLSPDYPSSWAALRPNIVPVTSSDRNGNLYNPGASAYGSNVLAAPGRRIIANGTEATGTSWATPIVAGVAALLVERFPNQSASAIRQALWSGSASLGNVVGRLDAYNALIAPVPIITLDADGLITIHGLDGWNYGLETSTDLVTWTATNERNFVFDGPQMFFRGVVL